MSQDPGITRPMSSLLDRLVRSEDDGVDSPRVPIDQSEGGQPTVVRHNRRAHVQQMGVLNRCISRDLVSLLGTRRMSVDRDLSRWPEVHGSVLNYGVADLSGTTISGTQTRRIERELRTVIRQFEPRLHAASVVVRCSFDAVAKNQLLVSVEADFGPTSAPEAFAMGLAICLVSGQCNWVDQAHAA